MKSAGVGVARKGKAFRGKKRISKIKSTDSLLYQAKKSVHRTIKLVKTYLIRKALRAPLPEQKVPPADLKALCCDAVTDLVMPVIRGETNESSSDDLAIRTVVNHRKVKEVLNEWTQKIATSREVQEKRQELKGGSSNRSEGQKTLKQRLANENKKKAIFVESLAEEAPQKKSKENKEWELKKRKALRSCRSDKVNLDVYMPLAARAEDSSRYVPSRLMALRASDAENMRSQKHGHAPSNPVESLHPSWAAKKMAKNKIAYTLSIPEGKKIVFNDDD